MLKLLGLGFSYCQGWTKERLHASTSKERSLNPLGRLIMLVVVQSPNLLAPVLINSQQCLTVKTSRACSPFSHYALIKSYTTSFQVGRRSESFHLLARGGIFGSGYLPQWSWRLCCYHLFHCIYSKFPGNYEN